MTTEEEAQKKQNCEHLMLQIQLLTEEFYTKLDEETLSFVIILSTNEMVKRQDSG